MSGINLYKHEKYGWIKGNKYISGRYIVGIDGDKFGAVKVGGKSKPTFYRVIKMTDKWMEGNRISKKEFEKAGE